ncbi:hypothetical protein K501DRAFT_87998 [Backusella circina FSU 941]|nr:hypothetical protein K501DRAFT_87998 [Backusella circina FSU 941]
MLVCTCQKPCFKEYNHSFWWLNVPKSKLFQVLLLLIALAVISMNNHGCHIVLCWYIVIKIHSTVREQHQIQ